MLKNLVVAASLAFTSNAFAAEFIKTNMEDGSVSITMRGEIVYGDSQKLANVLEDIIASNKKTGTLFLNSPGGRVNEGVMLSNVVRNYELPTIVMDGEQCASACFMVFAAGATKLAGTGAYVGVHHAAGLDGNVTDGSVDATKTMARVSARLGVSPEIIYRMQNTAPNDIAWLSADELKAMGAKVWSPSKVQHVSTQEPAQQVSNTKNAEWKNYIGWVYKMSASQNNGTARFSKKCFKNYCQSLISYYEKSGRFAQAFELSTKDGQIFKRDTCRSTYESDTYRVCTDFDTGKNTAENFDSSTQTWK